MLKKYFIIIFVILSVIFAKDILLKYDTNYNYQEITKQFKFDYESTEKISLKSLKKYKEFLEEKKEKADIFVVDRYIKYVDSTLSKKEEEDLKANTYKSKYLNSKILGGSLLYKYYLENNKDGEAKELIEDIFNEIQKKQFMNNTNEISYFLQIVASETNDKSIAIDILESLIKNDYIFMTDRVKIEIYDELRYLYIYTNSYALASEVSIRSIIIANQLKLNEQVSEGLIELAQIFKKLGGIESGIEMLQKSLSIDIEDEFTNADIKTYGLLTLGELYLTNKDYESAKQISSQIPKYENSIPKGHYRDVEILKYIMDARIAIMENDLELAQEYLNYSKHLQEIDEDAYYVGKEISYSLALGEFYEASYKYEDAIQLYKSMLDENKGNDYIQEKVLTA